MSVLTAYEPSPAMQRTSSRSIGSLASRAFWLGLALCLAGSARMNAQITTISQGSQLPSPQIVGSMPDPYDGPSDGSNPAFQRRRLEALNAQRQKEIVSDTNKLVKLTAKLNAEIGKSQAKTLNPDQLRMVEKIEKLAKSVREKMSTPVGGFGFDQVLPATIPPVTSR